MELAERQVVREVPSKEFAEDTGCDGAGPPGEVRPVAGTPRRRGGTDTRAGQRSVKSGPGEDQVRKYFCLAVFLAASGRAGELPELQSPQFRTQPLRGLGVEKGICRRDPSDVIRVGETYFVWYTKVVNGPGIFQYPSGYTGSVWYATSEDGQSWKERGVCVRKGAQDAWDGHGVFTPGILAANGKYYLFYDGVPNPMTP